MITARLPQTRRTEALVHRHPVSCRWLRLASWLPLLVAVTAIGCSKPVKLVPVSGVLTIGGKPAEGIVVQFLPEAVEGEKRPTSYATTADDGSFTLVTTEGLPGAVEGSHAVVLADTLEERPAQGQRVTRPPRLNSRFATISGGLTASVTEGGGPINLDVPPP